MTVYKDWHSEAIDLHKNGFSSRQIANTLGKGKSSVNDLLVKWYKEKPQDEVNIKKKGPRILIYDIETKYMSLEGFGLFNQNFSVDQIAEDWTILSYSAKWSDEDTVIYSDVSEKTEDQLLAELHALMDEADFAIAHNGNRFDWKKIRSRMITRGFKPFSPVRKIDTLLICKKEFGFTSNKLLYLTRLLCKKHKKTDHEKFAGMRLWQEFVKGNPDAIREMREYNMLDVLSLQELYEIIAPWSSNLPVFEVYDDTATLGEEWVKDGFVYTNMAKYQRYKNIITGQYRRGRVNLLSKEKRASLLSNIA